MALSLIVNAGLMALPIGGCLGTLFGIDAHRAATGQRPLFAPNPNDPDENRGTGSSGGGQDSTGGGSGGSSGGDVSDNGIQNNPYCQLSYGISPPSKDGETFTREFSTNPSPIILEQPANFVNSQSQPVECRKGFR